MSIWNRLSKVISEASCTQNIQKTLDLFRGEPEHSVAFTMSIIALSAKIAKADGKVTKDEVAAFREIFIINKKDEENAAKFFNIARQDVSGFEAYAHTIARRFHHKMTTKIHVVEGLFHIALADGNYHPAENDYVHRVAEIFNIDDDIFRSMRARFAPDQKTDAYEVLGVSPNMKLNDIKARWRRLVRETHPDQLIADGLPEEAITLATRRMIDVNNAWAEIYTNHA